MELKNNELLINVRFSDIDSMMLAHNSKYYIWFEEGRFNFAFNVLKFNYNDLNQSILLPVIKSMCKYFAPIRLGNTLLVQAFMHLSQAAKLTFYYSIKKAGTEIVHAIGKTEHALITAAGKILLTYPKDVKEKFNNAMQGQEDFFISDSVKEKWEINLSR